MSGTKKTKEGNTLATKGLRRVYATVFNSEYNPNICIIPSIQEFFLYFSCISVSVYLCFQSSHFGLNRVHSFVFQTLNSDGEDIHQSKNITEAQEGVRGGGDTPIEQLHAVSKEQMQTRKFISLSQLLQTYLTSSQCTF